MMAWYPSPSIRGFFATFAVDYYSPYGGFPRMRDDLRYCARAPDSDTERSNIV